MHQCENNSGRQARQTAAERRQAEKLFSRNSEEQNNKDFNVSLHGGPRRPSVVIPTEPKGLPNRPNRNGPPEHIFEGFLLVPDGPPEHIFEGFLPVPDGPDEHLPNPEFTLPLPLV